MAAALPAKGKPPRPIAQPREASDDIDDCPDARVWSEWETVMAIYHPDHTVPFDPMAHAANHFSASEHFVVARARAYMERHERYYQPILGLRHNPVRIKEFSGCKEASCGGAGRCTKCLREGWNCRFTYEWRLRIVWTDGAEVTGESAAVFYSGKASDFRRIVGERSLTNTTEAFDGVIVAAGDACAKDKNMYAMVDVRVVRFPGVDDDGGNPAADFEAVLHRKYDYAAALHLNGATRLADFLSWVELEPAAGPWDLLEAEHARVVALERELALLRLQIEARLKLGDTEHDE